MLNIGPRFAQLPVLPPPSVVSDEVSVSASQFKTFERCQRLWWFEKVAKVRDREKQHFVVGHALHERAEIYQIGAPGQSLFPPGWDKGLDDDERTWLRKCTDAAISLGLWQRVPGRLVEFPVCMLVGKQFTDKRGMPLLARAEVYLDEKGVRKIRKPAFFANGDPLPRNWDFLPHYNGFIDFLDPVAVPLIGDHKSAKSRKYALTPEKLANDTQMLCYSAAVCGIVPEAETVNLRHNVFLKDPAAPTPVYTVNATITAERAAIHWKKIIDHSERMVEIRTQIPAGVGPERAANWHLVRSAIEEGNIKEGCDAYGGCPLRDVCFGRLLVTQVLARLDSPDPSPLSKPPEIKFGLNIKQHLPATPAQESSMPFVRPAPTFIAGQDVYVLDPDNAAVQFRARIDVLDMPPADATQPTTESTIILWPDADVEPKFDSLGAIYRILVPKAALMALPSVTAKVVGYAQALREAGVKDGIEWTPAIKAATTVATPAVETAKAPDTEKAPTFGLKVPNRMANQLPPAALVPPTVVSGTGTIKYPEGVVVGTNLLVAYSDDPFWSKLVGKTAVVTEITPSEIPGKSMFTVEIEGHPYPDVLPKRFTPMPVDHAMVAGANLGKLVHVEFVNGATAINVTVEQVTAEGFVALAGTRTVLWGEIKTLEAFDEKKHVPDRKPTKEEKAEAKAAAKEEKAAAKEAAKAAAKEEASAPAAQATEAEAAAAPTGTALELMDQAIAAVDTALTAGKVTRKLVEGILPLIKLARSKMGDVTDDLPCPGVAIHVAAGDPQLRGTIQIAINHAISVLTDAVSKIEK